MWEKDSPFPAMVRMYLVVLAYIALLITAACHHC